MLFILAFVLIVLLLLLWLSRKGQHTTPDGFGTRIVDPNFQPGPRPPETFVDPPRQNVDIRIQRNAQGVPVDLTIGQRDLRLAPAEQAAWAGGPATGNNGVKVEIRFSPNDTPFGGSTFATARSGTALSGRVTRSGATGRQRKYTILATTPEGFLLTKTATVAPTGDSPGQDGPSYQQHAAQFNQPAPEGGFGERIEDPAFEPIDRPLDVEVPPDKEVKITVIEREGNIVDILVEPEEVSIGLFEQVQWTTGSTDNNSGAKLEIRFAPNATPFNGDILITARGGKLFSGLPQIVGQTFIYKVLVTTTDGLFQLREKDAKVTSIS